MLRKASNPITALDSCTLPTSPSCFCVFIPCLGSAMLQLKNKSVNCVPSIYHRDQPAKSSVHSPPDAGAIRTDQSQLPIPLPPHQFFLLSGWLPTGGPAVKGECDFLQESLSTRVRTTVLCLGTTESLSHSTWNGILCIWKRAPLGSKPSPAAKWCTFPQSTLSSGHKNALPLRHTFLPAVGFPSGLYQNQREAHFLGRPSVCILWHFNLVIKQHKG